MIDYRIYTFLELCTVMNYRKTAENLYMTQPAVTQHIHYLEGSYNCKLFDYSNKKLKKTKKGIELEKAARSIVALSLSTKKKLTQPEKIMLNIGATRSIGEYYINERLLRLIKDEHFEINLVIDNTVKLLERLNKFELDVLLIEGFVDKNTYNYKLISEQEIIGICAKEHPFANKEIPLESIFTEKIIIRESGSGTRAVLDNFLRHRGFSIESINRKSILSSNKLIELAVQQNVAISFVYNIIPQKNKNLATFRIQDSKIMHEFNYVFLKNTEQEKTIELLDEIKPYSKTTF